MEIEISLNTIFLSQHVKKWNIRYKVAASIIKIGRPNDERCQRYNYKCIPRNHKRTTAIRDKIIYYSIY
jgi:hypothetical protein